MYVPGAQEDQERALDPLHLELQTVKGTRVSWRLGAGPLEEEPAFLPTAAPLQPQTTYLNACGERFLRSQRQAATNTGQQPTPQGQGCFREQNKVR